MKVEKDLIGLFCGECSPEGYFYATFGRSDAAVGVWLLGEVLKKIGKYSITKLENVELLAGSACGIVKNNDVYLFGVRANTNLPFAIVSQIVQERVAQEGQEPKVTTLAGIEPEETSDEYWNTDDPIGFRSPRYRDGKEKG